MNRLFASTARWRGGALVGALLLAAALAGPATAQNKNLTATAQYSASSSWAPSGDPDPLYVPARAFDGNLGTRWNAVDGEAEGAWLAAEWTTPQTINKVVVLEAFNRISKFTIQQQTASKEWETVYLGEGDRYDAALRDVVDGNATFVVRLDKPITSTGLRVVFDEAADEPSVREIEAYNVSAGTLIGTVTDSAGKPIEGALVQVTTESTTTNAEGKYTLAADIGGIQTVTVSKPGSFSARHARRVEIPVNGTATRDFVLSPIPTNLSLSATAVSSSNYQDLPDYDADKAKDGDLTTWWNGEDGPVGSAYLEMQWDQPQTFNKVTIREKFGRVRNYSLHRYDEANAAYVELKTADTPPGSGDRNYSHIFATPVTSKRVRYLVNAQDEPPSPGIYELEVINAPIGTVKGVVKDATSGNPVSGATIASIDDPTMVLATTNEKGEFSLVAGPDEYEFIASAQNYSAGTPVVVAVNADQTSEISLTLQP